MMRLPFSLVPISAPSGISGVASVNSVSPVARYLRRKCRVQILMVSFGFPKEMNV